VLALGVLVTPMFNAARGSILIPMLFHFQMNNPAWPEAQPWENYLPDRSGRDRHHQPALHAALF
jgi:hypothetical protein